MLEHHNTAELSEHGGSSKSPRESAEQDRMLPDANAVILQTKAEIEKARRKADELIEQFAKHFVAAAGQLREEAIQRYRRRLEALPPDVCATVCDTLATDDDFCAQMLFGEGRVFYGGMSLKFSTGSDEAFNALSHHVWKDFYQSFSSYEPPPPSSNVLDRGLPSTSRLAHPDEQDRSASDQNRPLRSSDESELSSVEHYSPLSGDSTGAFQTDKRGRCQSNSSPSPGSATDNQFGNLDTSRRCLTGQSSKCQSGPDTLEKQGRSRPPSTLWSPEEEALIREMMAVQLKGQGNLEIGLSQAKDLHDLFPGRSVSAIRNKWRTLKAKQTQSSWVRTEANSRTHDAKHQVPDRDTEHTKRDQGGSGPTMEHDQGGGDDQTDHAVNRGSQVSATHVKNNKWTPEQDQLLKSTVQSKMQSSAVVTISIPPLVKKELAKSLGRSEKAISRRWAFLSGDGKRHETQEPRKSKEKDESQAESSSSRPQASDTARRPEAARGPGPRCPVQAPSSTWSREEHISICRSTHGLIRSQIDFKKVASALPDPSRRTASACRSYWKRYIHPTLVGQGGNPFQVGDAPKESTGSGTDHPHPRHSETGRTQESNRGPPGEADSAVSVTRGSKHERDSDDECERQSSTSRKKHNRLPHQSSLDRRENDGVSEGEGHDVYRYESE
ncbi:hypothetical protein KVR01_007695 [Diaporthe batatas]|uniref:uncharacterized protein n=1 Tax=Diaporthe batatas TaxID=748121 RepID=UPI001D054EF2|nr:uncharacterized protein KVR01_007695 [Diaporthe batatas]KAG8161930.1 hypothetical protein KVR01_007695 [Diaporthe batatas]